MSIAFNAGQLVTGSAVAIFAILAGRRREKAIAEFFANRNPDFTEGGVSGLTEIKGRKSRDPHANPQSSF